eukprot:1140218-Prymnesium_polylepis.1
MPRTAEGQRSRQRAEEGVETRRDGTPRTRASALTPPPPPGACQLKWTARTPVVVPSPHVAHRLRAAAARAGANAQ